MMKQLKRRARVLFRRKRNLVIIVVASLQVITLTFLIINMNNRPTKVHPVAYQPLLSIIAKGESSGNYNAYFGNAQNKDVRLTEMTIAQVLEWQQKYVQDGSPSSAAGRYQIIRPTLESLVNQLQLDRSQKFNEAMQDRMAIALMERRGSIDYIDEKLSREQFAANIAQEWAALPKVTGPNPDQSHYAGDGLNKASISIDEIVQAIDAFKSAHVSHQK